MPGIAERRERMKGRREISESARLTRVSLSHVMWAFTRRSLKVSPDSPESVETDRRRYRYRCIGIVYTAFIHTEREREILYVDFDRLSVC